MAATPPTSPSPALSGIHHVTAIASDPQTNVDFYSGLLGLRLVKRTVNFDDPRTYHLYYGDQAGHPGTILTFFPWPGARRGQRGVGQATTTAFSIPESSMGFWIERLKRQRVVFEDPKERFDEEVLTFLDPDGLKLELIAHAVSDDTAPWQSGDVPERHAIRGFHGVTLEERDAAPTAAMLETLGYDVLSSSGPRTRFHVGEGGVGTLVDVLERGDGQHGHVAAGTVHHVAFRTDDDASQEAWQDTLAGQGVGVTEVRDRQYFRSIYFREPGGVLFEIATDPPGFTRDETLETLGTTLKLPSWLEPHRQDIERALPELKTTEVEEEAIP